MKKIFRKGMIALTLVAGLAFATPQQTFANGFPDPPKLKGYECRNIQLVIFHPQGTDLYLMICRDGDTGAIIWTKVLGGDYIG